jgi:tRNA(adenine34) deaminase
MITSELQNQDLNQHDIYWMRCALNLAEQAAHKGEVPVGAVLVLNNQLFAEGWNKPISQNDPTAHAEIIALRQGAQQLNNYRLLNTTLYVTLEPCAMCAGAMMQARIQRVVYGAKDPRAGAAGSVFSILQSTQLNHRIICDGGILEQECGDILRQFFKDKR